LPPILLTIHPKTTWD